jgi:hypothetical protein
MSGVDGPANGTSRDSSSPELSSPPCSPSDLGSPAARQLLRDQRDAQDSITVTSHGVVDDRGKYNLSTFDGFKLHSRSTTPPYTRYFPHNPPHLFILLFTFPFNPFYRATRFYRDTLDYTYSFTLFIIYLLTKDIPF